MLGNNRDNSHHVHVYIIRKKFEEFCPYHSLWRAIELCSYIGTIV